MNDVPECRYSYHLPTDDRGRLRETQGVGQTEGALLRTSNSILAYSLRAAALQSPARQTPPRSDRGHGLIGLILAAFA